VKLLRFGTGALGSIMLMREKNWRSFSGGLDADFWKRSGKMAQLLN
jgi:hypothetical protein